MNYDEFFNSLLERLRHSADAVVSAFFSADKPKEREKRRAEIESWFAGGTDIWPKVAAAAAELQAGMHPVRPFHWELEFPEAFAGDNPGFDAMVGNPPFAGKNNIIHANRRGFLDWLLVVHQASHGNSDLAAHFFRRAHHLIRDRGQAGFVTTSRISEGDTRTTGLSWISANGGEIVAASTRATWTGDADVQIRAIQISKGLFAGPRVLGGKIVAGISASLEPIEINRHDSVDDPVELERSWGLSFVGHAPHGAGFILSAEEATQLLSQPKNAEVVRPFLIAKDLNESPYLTPSRSIVDFGDRTLEEAQQYSECFELVCRRVKPYRQSNKRKAYREKWWLFGERRAGLAQAASRTSKMIACAMTSMEFKFAEVPTTYVFDQTLAIVEATHAGCLGILESSVHKTWAMKMGASFGSVGAPRYNPSRCFRTFPFPSPTIDSSQLVKAETAFISFRGRMMSDMGIGLTELYNRFHNSQDQTSELIELRKLHLELDRATLATYGWSDLVAIAIPQDLTADNEDDSRYRGRRFWSAAIRTQVISRLLDLNAEHARAEAVAGPPARGGGGKGKKPRRNQLSEATGPTLF